MTINPPDHLAAIIKQNLLFFKKDANRQEIFIMYKN